MNATEPSRLPQRFSEGRIGVIAGGGALPLAVIRTLSAHSADPFVILIDGEADDPASYGDVDHLVITLEDVGLLLPQLKKAGVKRLVMAGSVKRRPRLRAVRWTFSTLKLIPRIAGAISGGDDRLLRTLVAIMEADGITVVGAHEVVPDLLAPRGTLTRVKPTKRDWNDIKAASEAAIAIGRLDIGQAAIAIGGRAVALEGIEGTEGLLERAIGLRDHGRLAGKRRGALVKLCKPDQEMRADLPAIGPDTMDQAHAAGLAGVAVDSGRSFILEFDATIARADELGLYLVGLDAEDVRS
ncbi:UDP-2,3-diacylglucosamine diphosphatase LpxI [Mesorhizobium sp. CAU 1741]|uniref:LpxI family protein n=1 Tax=Mesorhizobium sp. CAU 1741 TaxID=3140366 RepID=UPI00325AD966